MRRPAGLVWLAIALLSLVLVGCGARGAKRRVIIPDPNAEVDATDFVINRNRGGDGRARFLVPGAPLPDIHVQEEWWPFRADFLRISERQARDRDAAVSDRQPPDRFWDEQTAGEALNVWSALCNECHGGRRRPEDVAAMPMPPPGWGRGEGVFFGNVRSYAQMFAMVWNGGPDKDGIRSEMPPWKGKIAREQIWALLYFLEYQSGGLDGPIPPSLRPRRPPGG